MFPESHGFFAMPVTDCIKDTCSNSSLSIVKGGEIVRPCDRRSNETVTLGKYVTKYKNVRKWMVEFLKTFKNRGIKSARVNWILITKFINLQLFTLIGIRCWRSVVILTSLN